MEICRIYVDSTPIRVFRNTERLGVAYPKSQPMRLYASIWDGDDWATRGGLDKTDWSRAPFVATYRGLTADACTLGSSACSAGAYRGRWWNQVLDVAGMQKVKWIRQRYMVYDYCRDPKRQTPRGPPPECAVN